MTKVIFANEGTLDKFVGDAIMAIWGAPIPQDDHALRGCKTALTMMRTLNTIRPEWEAKGKPSINIRVGLNTGDMIVGNMGGVGRFDYTVIGDSVNLASRLESANKQYHTRIMIGANTYKHVENDVVVRQLDSLVVVGKTEPIKVYELIALANEHLADDRRKMLDIYNKGLILYRKRDWASAIAMVEEALKFVPDDYPSKIYIERSGLYRITPPPDDWNGAFVLKSK